MYGDPAARYGRHVIRVAIALTAALACANVPLPAGAADMTGAQRSVAAAFAAAAGVDLHDTTPMLIAPQQAAAPRSTFVQPPPPAATPFNLSAMPKDPAMTSPLPPALAKAAPTAPEIVPPAPAAGPLPRTPAVEAAALTPPPPVAVPVAALVPPEPLGVAQTPEAKAEPDFDALKSALAALAALAPAQPPVIEATVVPPPAKATPDLAALKAALLAQAATTVAPTPQAVPAPTPAEKPEIVTVALRSVPPLSGLTLPPWQRNAVTARDTAGKPRIALVIDDVGVDYVNSLRAVALPGPVTISLMTYARQIERLADIAHANGNELLIHVPMEPEGFEDPGPNVLATNLDPAELERRVQWALNRVDGVVGINNHMGSKFTANARGMRVLMDDLAERGYLFLDSRTTGQSVGREAARLAGVPYVARDVFLDNDPSPEVVWKQIEELEATAKRRGSAIAIAHPHPGTLQVLRAWLPELAKRGYALVPLSALVPPPGPPSAAVAAR